jgi:AcrR family transcriptional regulator
LARISAVERRKTFIAAAVDVIAEYGVDGATTRRIAEKADAPLASLHYVFSSKEDLFAAVYEELIEVLRQKIAPVKSQRPGLSVSATRVLRQIMEWFRREPEFAGAAIELLGWARRQGDDVGRQAYEAVFAAIGEALLQGMDDHEDPQVAAALPPLIAALCDGYVLQWLTYGSSRDALADIDTASATLASVVESLLAGRRTAIPSASSRLRQNA